MCRTQVLTVVLLGAWIALTLAMWFAATRSFRTANRVLESSASDFEAAIGPLGKEGARMVLRHLASEINRSYFAAYGWTQFLLAIILLGLTLLRSPRDSVGVILTGTMFALVLVLTFVIQPRIVELGRTLDFVARDPVPAAMPRFWRLHGAFTALDGTKLLAALALLARWIWHG